MFGVETTISMVDDGTGSDAQADDGVFTAVIPSSASGPGDMLRWRVEATDELENVNHEPLFLDQTGSIQSPEYFGTVIADTELVTQLSTLHWFVESPLAAGTGAGTRSSIFFDGEFYDNVFSRVDNATVTTGVKKSYRHLFNAGHDFRYSPDDPRVTEINVSSTFQDKAYIRPELAFEAYAEAGVPASDAFTWRIEQNGEFFSVASVVERVG